MRSVPIIRVFGYGSLLNEKNVRERLPGQRIVRRATVSGFQRTFRKLGSGHVYLTLRKSAGHDVTGTLLDLSPPELAILTHHEPGYELLDVTGRMADYPADEPRVYCFIAPAVREIPSRLRSIRRSYIKKCLDGVPAEERDRWMAETEIPEGVTIAEDA